MTFGTGKDFLKFHDLQADVVIGILARAGELAEAWCERCMPQSLESRRIALIVDDGGWRNTTAFDLGIQAMGGICVHVPVRLGGKEAIADLAGYLDNWFDMIIVRTREFGALSELAAHAKAPVINARTRSNHPCETLGDLAHILQKRGRLDGLKVAGVAPDDNILRSWAEASISLPVDVVQVYPEPWHVRDAALLSGRFRTSTNMGELEDADVIITDCWPGGAAVEEVEPYRISAAVLNRCKPGVFFIPCPPVTRDHEVAADAMIHPACWSREAKAFLLHAQNALMEWIAARAGVSASA
ncbi:ornithine carbamoyltransferase [Rhizobium terrae]|uniref:ornithine carbamoyltransferase n=1 Tax=Rhizobium terrae TaxID=2171756 RepID=UPI000E3EC3C7|nr:ornithine carbamoyltransferase [Rhizobium terrae]